MSEEKSISVFDMTPKNMEEAEKFSEMIANSAICPPDYKGKPGDILVCMQMGSEVGLKPMQSLQNIAVINGRPSIWGDAIPALIKIHPKFISMEEWFDENLEIAYCTITRKGEPPHTQQFSKADAVTAGLAGKNTYKAYLRRMLQMRARSWAARDTFPDAMKGLSVVEEAYDIPENEKPITHAPARDMGEAVVVEDKPASRTAELSNHLESRPDEPTEEQKEAKIRANGIAEAMNNAQTIDELTALGDSGSDLKDENRELIKIAYRNRRDELKAFEETADNSAE